MDKFYGKMDEKLMPLFFEELKKIHFDELGKYNWGTTCLHTINVVHCCVNHQIFKEHLCLFEKNIVKWAALLHDIIKRGDPLFEGKDHIHPFLSGRKTLQIFANLGIINIKGKET